MSLHIQRNLPRSGGRCTKWTNPEANPEAKNSHVTRAQFTSVNKLMLPISDGPGNKQKCRLQNDCNLSWKKRKMISATHSPPHTHTHTSPHAVTTQCCMTVTQRVMNVFLVTLSSQLGFYVPQVKSLP